MKQVVVDDAAHQHRVTPLFGGYVRARVDPFLIIDGHRRDGVAVRPQKPLHAAAVFERTPGMQLRMAKISIWPAGTPGKLTAHDLAPGNPVEVRREWRRVG